MNTIKQTYVIDAPIKDVWWALTDPDHIDQWGGGKAKMTDKVGAAFELWSGDIWGTNLEVILNKKLVQEWHVDDQKTPTKVTFMLKSLDRKTQIDLIQEDVEESALKDLENGWHEYYLGAMKKYLEQS